MANEPKKVHILEQLQKIVSSERFARSPRKREFLRYIVEKTLDGDADGLSGYSIGVDVFERRDDFDPQADTIVRVQARNLRRALRHYYLTTGKNDSVLIDVPKGNYVPFFSFKDATPIETPGSAETPQVAHIGNSDKKYRRLPHVFIFTLVVSAVLVSGFLLRGDREELSGFDQATQVPTGPSITIQPFEIFGTDFGTTSTIDAEALQVGLHFELVDKITRFKNLYVVASSVSPKSDGARDDPEIKTQYVLTGAIQLAGAPQSVDSQLKITSILTRTSNGQILWTHHDDAVLTDISGLQQFQTKLAVSVASSLGQPYSRINSILERDKSKYKNVNWDHYSCLMQFYQYGNRKTEKIHFAVRNCLEKAVAELPNFSSAWAALSFMYADEKSNQYNLRADQAPPFERAHAAALKAVEADPDNAMAYQYLAIAKFFIEDDLGFKDAAATALMLNPNDTEILANIGSCLIQIENSEQGKDMVEKAIRMNPAHPSWYHTSIMMYYYSRNEKDKALYHAREYSESGSLSALTLLTAALVQSGKIEESKSAFRALEQTYPSFTQEYRTVINSWRLPDGMHDQLVADLIIAGLTPVL